MSATTKSKAADAGRSPDSHHKALPPVTGDFYNIASTLPAEDAAVLQRVRTFMEEEVAPIITRYWIRAEFPFELIPKLAALDIAGLSYQGYGCPGKSTTLDGLVALEMARIDASMATFFALVCIAGLPWDPFISAAAKRRSNSGCRRCDALRRSGRLVLLSRT
jgi:alkylation response protein AidB-like acyl-CoA dehydrogenase